MNGAKRHMEKAELENALNSLLIFTIETRHFALNVFTVERVIRAVEVTPLVEAQKKVLGLINYGGQIIPVIDTRELFGLPAREMDPMDQLIIVNTSSRTLALWVDAVSDITDPQGQDIVQGGSILPNMDYVKGAIACDDGMIFICNLEQLHSFQMENTLENND